jgi:hypothetical protein
MKKNIIILKNNIARHYTKMMALVFYFVAPTLVSAAANTGLTFTNPLKGGVNNISGLIALVMQLVARVGAIIVVFYMIYAGFLFVEARGNESKIKTAKANFTYAVIGAIILLGAEVLARVIKNTAAGLGVAV